MLIDILTPFCIQTGYDIVNQRQLALSWINRASKEVYDSLEADDGLMEVILLVPADKQITLPSYIGELRGLREYKYGSTIPLDSIGSPQYTSNTWQFMWRNWRQKGTSPIHTSISNAGVLTITTPVVDSGIVTITMQTTNSSRVVEQVTMNALTKVTTNSPVKIFNISSATKGRIYNYTIKDITGTEIAVLENKETITRYRVIDVSEFQWTGAYTTEPNTTLVECLFKPTLYPLYYDTDEFTALGYDDAIQYKAMEMWYYGQEGKELDSLAFNKKCQQAIDLATRNQESGETKMLLFQPNPIYAAFDRLKHRMPINRDSGFGGFPYLP